MICINGKHPESEGERERERERERDRDREKERKWESDRVTDSRRLTYEQSNLAREIAYWKICFSYKAETSHCWGCDSENHPVVKSPSKSCILLGADKIVKVMGVYYVYITFMLLWYCPKKLRNSGEISTTIWWFSIKTLNLGIAHVATNCRHRSLPRLTSPLIGCSSSCSSERSRRNWPWKVYHPILRFTIPKQLRFTMLPWISEFTTFPVSIG